MKLLLLLAACLCCLSAFPSESAGKQAIDIGLVKDDAGDFTVDGLVPGSHVKLFLPHLTYLSISHSINGALLRPANNERGWDYYLATNHQKLSDTVWEFTLRDDAFFHDGSHFNADSVVENMGYFAQQPFLFSKMHEVFDRVEKVDDYRVRFFLSEPSGAFLYDAIWLQFYTTAYLKKFGWNGKSTCPNLAEAGPYGLGPYMLVEGYVEGDRRTAEIVLKANPNYWGENKPKVETVTIYTETPLAQARDSVLFTDGEIDITPVAFADQLATIMSPYGKLAESTSLNNYSMHINMLNGNEALKDARIRHAINAVIDQESLLNLSMLGSGVLSPTMVSPNFYRLDESLALLDNYFAEVNRDQKTNEQLKQVVQSYQVENGLDPEVPLAIRLIAQESFHFLISDIRYFLSLINIELVVETVTREDQAFEQLFATWRGQNRPWDLLLWGNYDWFKHPWAAFFVYRPLNDWSSLPEDRMLSDLSNRVLAEDIESAQYPEVIAEMIKYVHQNNLMVFLPTPNNVFAVNKEVVFHPGRSAYVYLDQIAVTEHHWSLRGEKGYPPERKNAHLQINRKNFEAK